MVEQIIVRGSFKSNTVGAVYSIILAVLLLLCVALPLPTHIITLSILLSVLFFYLAWVCHNTKNQELIITPQKIYGSINRKRIELPVDKITAVETSRRQGITVTTSAGRITVDMCINRDEIADIISKLLFCRVNGRPCDGVYTLKIYRELLEEGTITQEEYQEKEKELLGSKR